MAYNRADSKRNESELKEKLVQVRRVTKVGRGGRVFAFSALVVVGNEKSRVGFGCGKAREVPIAVRKAVEQARRNLISVEMKGNTLQYPMAVRYGATRVHMQPASEGTGVIAGGAARAVFELCGIRDILTKCYGSTTPINVIRAVFAGLQGMYSPEYIARKREKDLQEIIG